jgi:cell division protein FtsQ
VNRAGGSLLVPGSRSGRPAEVATRRSLIANQRHRARRLRWARRALRLAGRGFGAGLVVGTVLVVGSVASHWIRHTPLLAVTAVEIEGLHRLPEGVVRMAAAVAPGTNLLAVDPAAVAARVEALPGVRRARVVRQLPDHVTLLVEERAPYVLLNVAGGPGAGSGRSEGLVWIDVEGYLVGTEPRPGTPALPILSGVARAGTGGDEEPSPRLRAGLALIRAVQRTGGRVAGRISEIDLTPADGPVLYTTDGAEVRVGDEAWGQRLARLDGVLADLDGHGERVLSVDLRFRDLVVLKPRVPIASPDPRGPAPLRRRPVQS